MTTLPMNRRRWTMAHRLAAELAQRDFDSNMLKTAASFMKYDPQADLENWLERLARLGNLFSLSNQTGRYRHELYEACRRLEPKPRTGTEWVLVLSWAARLFTYYEANLNEARRISNVSSLVLPPPPEVFQPPPPPKVEPTDDIPEPAEEVSDLAKAFMERFKKK